MKLKDFLKQFEGMDMELPVALEDWNEQYMPPCEWAAEYVEVVETRYTTTELDDLGCPIQKTAKVIVIGK